MMDTGRISELLEKLAQEHRVPGAQLAVHRDGETRSVAVGHQDGGAVRTMTGDAKVPLGSVTKVFTADLAMVLVAEGDLELDVPVSRYATELRDTPGDVLTLRHLLSHTGGLPSDAEHSSAPSLRRYVLEGLRDLRECPQPCRDFSYSNIGYDLVGHLVERATGMSWWEAVEAILLVPLGITPAFVVAPDGSAPRVPIVTGHVVNQATGGLAAVEQSLTAADAPAGGLAASAADLVALGRSHLDRGEGAADPPLDAETLAEMHRVVPGTDAFGLADGWGLGTALMRAETGDWWGHDGMADGTSCHLRIDPAGQTVVALTTNANTGFALWKQLVTELRSVGLAIGDYEAPIDTTRRMTAPPECAGDYANGDVEYVIEPQEDGTLRVVTDGQPAAMLTIHDGLVFSTHDLTAGRNSYAGRFLRDQDSGQIDRIQVSGRIARRVHRERQRAEKFARGRR
jgi:CubicO group peptidase (beta-lactamase class C family)